MKKSIKTMLTILMLSVFSAQAQQPGYYRMQIGDFEVIALSDGTIPQELPKLLTNIQPKEITTLLQADYLPATVETSVNAYLVKTEDKLILIDAGTSDNYGPSLGRLSKSLLNAGYTPEQIDAILITHVHIDHTGGLMHGTKMIFPNAIVYLSKPESDFWFDEQHKRNATEKLKPYYQYAEASVGAYLKAGKVKTFTYGQELFPGIRPIAGAGHTPGHTFYELSSRGQKLVFWGDIIHAAAIQFADPAVTIEYDVDPAAAAATRKKAFLDAAKNSYWIASDHISFPGIGQVKSEGSKYVWIPANYSSAEVPR